MKTRIRVIAGAALAIAVVGGTAGITLASDHGHTLLRGDVMVGVSPPYTSSSVPATQIRGLNGGGAPWVIGDAEFRVRTDGRVDVEFEGLLIGPGGPPALVGTNPALNQKVIVSCLSIDAAGASTTVNAPSESFPVDGVTGNADARVHVDLPSPCIAPIIFVTSLGGSWFAASGA